MNEFTKIPDNDVSDADVSGSDVAKPTLSLIERAAQIYDFGSALRDGAAAAIPVPPVRPMPEPVPKTAPNAVTATLEPAIAKLPPLYEARGDFHPLDRESLVAEGFVDPAGPPTGLSEELRIMKRQLLARAFAPDATPRDRLVLISSAHPGDGKTWLTINLALSLSAERDLDILLVDSDVGKPSLCKQLGLPAGPGFMDILVDPSLDVASLVVRTDLPNLSVLRAGRQLNDDTEVLASDRTRAVLDSLVAGSPRRVVLFDSPPALAASAASELARYVGLVLLVVRADKTSDVALRDAAQLLSACPNIHAVLNGVKFSSSGRLFGAYGKRS
ncbi:XrtA-associated tyrosine autokinase [soil metagenome]